MYTDESYRRVFLLLSFIKINGERRLVMSHGDGKPII